MVMVQSMVNAVLLSLALPMACHSFGPPVATAGTSRRTDRLAFGFRLDAKPKPISHFDLASIEAFEMEIEALEAAGSDSNDAGNDIDLADDILDGDGLVQGSLNVEEFIVEDDSDCKGKRIDAALAMLIPRLSRSHCGNLVTDGRVVVVEKNKASQTMKRKSYKVEAGTTIRVDVPSDETPTEIIPEDIPLNILYEDEHMIVLNKAADMVVHPAAGNWDGTVVNALAHYLQTSQHGSGDFVDGEGTIQSVNAEGILVDGTDGETVSFRPGIVHRLDKGTTGVLVVAKTRSSLAALSAAFKARTVKKTYLAVTVGNPGKRIVIDKPIGRHPVHRQRMRVVPDPHNRNSRGLAPKDRMIDNRPTSQTGRALSFVDTITFDGKLSLAQVSIQTGRTHQIRVHLQDRTTPVYGDDVYGLTDWNKKLSKTHQIGRPLLHAYTLELDHPITGERMAFRAPMADDMMKIVTAIWPQGKEERPDLFQD